PQTKHQHGFKASHTTTTALHQLTNQITQDFNQKQPPQRTIVVSLELSKAFDTVDIHSLINKLHQTAVPNNIIKFIANYKKDTKALLNVKPPNPSHRNSKPKFLKEEYYLLLSSIYTPL